jgi:Flp pilus assembly protein TadD
MEQTIRDVAVDAKSAPDALTWRSALLALTLLTIVVALTPQQPGVTALLAAANQQRANYRYDRALALEAEARAEDPNDPRPACAQGQTLLLQREVAAAVVAYQTCVALAPDNASDWLALGDSLAAANASRTGVSNGAASEAAASAWTHAARLGSDDAWARLALRDERLGRLSDATSAWAQVTPEGALSELASAHLGLLALARGDVVAARGHLALLATSRDTLATQLLDNGVFLFDQRPPVVELDWLGIGYALLAMNLPAVALGPLQRAVALAPTDGAAQAYYGYALWTLGQRAAARPHIAAGLTGRFILPFAWYAAGLEALNDGHAAQALTDFQTGALTAPKNPALWSAAGDAAVGSGQFLVAELSYQNAAQYSATPDATITLIQFYLEHGLGLSDGTAIKAAREGLFRFPDSEPLAVLEGLIYQTQGQQDYAQNYFTYAQQLDPTDPGPWFYLGSMAAATGEIVTAVVDLRTALALQPSGPFAAKARAALVTLPSTSM